MAADEKALLGNVRTVLIVVCLNCTLIFPFYLSLVYPNNAFPALVRFLCNRNLSDNGSFDAVCDDGTFAILWPIYSELDVTGCLPAGLIAPFLSDNLGRRKTFLIGAALLAAGNFLQYLSSMSACPWAFLIVGRLVAMAFGTVCGIVLPVVVTEISAANIRGKMGCLQTIFNVLGATAACVLALPSAWGTEDSWHLSYLVLALITVLSFPFISWMHETPAYLVSQNLSTDDPDKLSAAADSLLFYRSTTVDYPAVSLDARNICEKVNFFRQIKVFWDPRFRIQTLLLLSLAMNSGILMLYNNFTTLALMNVGYSQDTSALLTTSMTASGAMVTLASFFLVDRKGRRPLFILSAIGALIAMLGLALVQLLLDVEVFPGLRDVFSILFAILFFAGRLSTDVGVRAVFWIVVSELFPMQLRASAKSLFFIAMTVTAIWLLPYPAMLQGGLGGLAYLLIALPLLVSSILAAKKLPETSGKEPHEIFRMFNPNVSDEELYLIQNN